MRLLAGLLFTFIVAGGVGLGTAWYALEHDLVYAQERFGAWMLRSRVGTREADPYTRAQLARFGSLPLAQGDGFQLTATADDEGRALESRCDVVVSGLTPTARFWTLTLYDGAGKLVPNAAQRHGFTSQEIVRATDGSFEIVIARRARPGNWLPTGDAETYVLVLRLFDVPGGVGGRVSGARQQFLTVTRRDCA